jgi:hypothetical protein
VLQTHGKQSLQASTTQSDLCTSSVAAPAWLAPSNAALTKINDLRWFDKSMTIISAIYLMIQ